LRDRQHFLLQGKKTIRPGKSQVIAARHSPVKRFNQR
jgi:hypothetical protein